jgi:hypothetical protein
MEEPWEPRSLEDGDGLARLLVCCLVLGPLEGVMVELDWRPHIERFIAEHISTQAPKGLTWEEWYALAALTGEIDWDCQFVDGNCKSNREHLIDRATCCCQGCYGTVGYLQQIPPGAEDEVYAAWNRDTGFWGAGTGCLLPRRLRSSLCLRFNCREPSPALTALQYLFDGGLPMGLLETTPRPFIEQVASVRQQLIEEGIINGSKHSSHGLRIIPTLSEECCAVGAHV